VFNHIFTSDENSLEGEISARIGFVASKYTSFCEHVIDDGDILHRDISVGKISSMRFFPQKKIGDNANQLTE
jgi:hypothetical protein